MYASARKFLFRLDPERSHALGMGSLDLLHRLGLSRLLAAPPVADPVTFMGLGFDHRVGLAAGLDKNAEHLDALGALGFAAVEVGTATPRPQSGNARPRLFRLPEHHAIINRMGFNNQGVDRLIANVARSRYAGVIGINIGKNLDTPVEKALDDYLTCLRRVHAHAHYIAVNISSPNTPGLRSLQFGDQLNALLSGLKAQTQTLDRRLGRRVPLAVKIAPDMTDPEIDLVAECLRACEIDAVIATNTTVERAAIADSPLAAESGGLSGRPVRAAATRVIERVRTRLPEIVIVGVGGIDSAEAALEKRRAGADLIQLYSGLIYRGPALVGECASALKNA